MKPSEVEDVRVDAGSADDPVETAYDVVHATRTQKQATNRLRWGLGLKPKDALPAIELIGLFGSEIAKDAAERRLIERAAERRCHAMLVVLTRLLARHRAEVRLAHFKTRGFGDRRDVLPDCTCDLCVQARAAVADVLGCTPEQVMRRINVVGTVVAGAA